LAGVALTVMVGGSVALVRRSSLRVPFPAPAASSAILGAVQAPVSLPVPVPAIVSAPATIPAPSTLAGLDLTKIKVEADTTTAPLAHGRTARLTVDPQLQKVARRVMASHHIPEAAVVVMDVETGKLLVYASHVERGPARDLAVEATAPAASVFKIVTGAALVEHAGATPEQKECYSGGEQRLHPVDLAPDPKRDRWCTTLSGAMGRSINTVFARLASSHLRPEVLERTAHSLGFGSALSFDVPVEASTIELPDDPLGYARTAAGFWNTTLSPLHAAWLGATLARGGEPVRPSLVSDVLEDGNVIWTAPRPPAEHRAMKADTARALTTMMEATVSDGTSYRAFHDARGRAYVPGVTIAGKTGTLTDANSQRLYTWFTGFGPSKPVVFEHAGEKSGREPAQPRKVAFGVLVVNDPKWTIKANVLAREVLAAYFANQLGSSQVREGGPAAASTTRATKHRLHRGS
jgi:peptidoglycan glycosyltransferase